VTTVEPTSEVSATTPGGDVVVVLLLLELPPELDGAVGAGAGVDGAGLSGL